MRVSYDGRIVSDRESPAGEPHVFTVTEGTEDAQYKVRLQFTSTAEPSVSVVRNGRIIHVKLYESMTSN